MKLMIAGGGTGGHLFSGVAVADALREEGGHTIRFVGTESGIEARLLPKLGYDLDFITVGGLKRTGWKRILNVLKIPVALGQSFRLLRRFRPDAVLGVGGYASGPLLLMAWLTGHPTVIIEQNSIPGLTNRILARLVRRIVVHFPDAGRWFESSKILPVGNPVRPSVVRRLEKPRTEPRDGGRLSILIVGGSQGAHGLNEVVRNALPELKPFAGRLSIRHQSGEADRKILCAAYEQAGLSASVEAFIDDMPKAYAHGDLVVCRAGAATCAELGVAGRPALFVPLPTATDDHQTKNAQRIVDAGGGWMMPQASATPAALRDFIVARLEHPEELERVGQAALAAGRPRAAWDVAELLKNMAHKPNG